ncbi:MAG TPA: PKD domain-containing protein [Thermoleophilaceae bacterium]
MRLALACALLAALVVAPSAEAYKRLNYRWPSRTITYYDSTGKAYSKNVAAAAAAWNRSGTKARWKKTSKSRARVLIRVNGKIPSAGLATYFGGQRGLIEIQPGMKKLRQTKAENEWVATTIMTHEMGHIMGLDHETKKCAVMQPAVGIGCPAPKDPWQFRCRVLEPDDVRGGVALFGGKVGKVGPEFCDSTSPPGAPTGVTAVYFEDGGGFDEEVPTTGVRVSWTTPKGGEPQQIRVLRRQDTCPAGAGDKQATEVAWEQATPGQSQSAVDQSGFPGPGSYCYAVFAIGAFERPGPAGTVVYQHTGPASPAYRPSASFDYTVVSEDGTQIAFEDFSDAGQGAELVAWRWDFADGTFSDERNPTHTFTPREQPYTVVLTVTDNRGQTDFRQADVYVEPPIDHGEGG